MKNAQECLLEAVWSSSTEELAKLIVQGVDVNDSPWETGRTLLHLAVDRGNAKIVKLLLEPNGPYRGAEANAQDSLGNTPLHNAAFYSDSVIISALLAHGAQVNAQNLQGLSPLHMAVRDGQMDMVALLIRHGADVTLPSAKGETALHFAARHGRVLSYRMLLENGADGSVCDNSGETPVGITERQSAMMFNRVVPDFVDIRPTLKHEYVCPYCQQNIKTWEFDSDGALQCLPSGPLVTDGDTILGIYEALNLAESDPCYYWLETACSCPHCDEQGFFVSVSNMSRKYDLRDYGVEGRLRFNMNHGVEELFKVHLDQYFLSSSKSPLKLWRHYASPNDGCWHMVEYKSPDLPPMVVHRFGPFRCDIGSIGGPYGVCACTADHSPEWQLAAGIITELWPMFWAIAEERQWAWENNSNSNEAIVS